MNFQKKRKRTLKKLRRKRARHGRISRRFSTSLNGRETDEGELIYGKHLAKDDFLQTWEIQKKYAADKEDEQRYHHSYQEERALQEAVRTGNIQEALARNVALMDTAGKMGTDMNSHWYNLAVSAITLITRSAIEGGLSPACFTKKRD